MTATVGATAITMGDHGTIFDLSRAGRRCTTLPALDVPEAPLPESRFLRNGLPLPEVSELDLVRHYTLLSQKNHSIETGFYPLGSCTMKYNPKRNETVAALPGFATIHPRQPEKTVQGALELLYGLQRTLAEITGMEAVTLTPSAGAHGEFTGMMLIRAFHRAHGQGDARRKVLVPDSAHGTNPATAAMCGYEVVSLGADADGNIDLEQLRPHLGPGLAGAMLTMPSTLGLFDPNIIEITRLVHEAGGLVYGDGANMNALLGRARPGDLGFDVIHVNLHKTFTTPHGGGGPGAGPVCVRSNLADFLPAPHVVKAGARFSLVRPKKSIGSITSFAGNFGILVRGYAYIRSVGREGLLEVSENAVINANYILANLRDQYRPSYDRKCMHEVVFAGLRERNGIKTLDVAKRLIDFGIHPPTIYFPLIVDEALMIEPTETESKETIDRFIFAMQQIAREAREDPGIIRSAPHVTQIGRLDEATAARKPILRWRPASHPNSA